MEFIGYSYSNRSASTVSLILRPVFLPLPNGEVETHRHGHRQNSITWLFSSWGGRSTYSEMSQLQVQSRPSTHLGHRFRITPHMVEMGVVVSQSWQRASPCATPPRCSANAVVEPGRRISQWLRPTVRFQHPLAAKPAGRSAGRNHGLQFVLHIGVILPFSPASHTGRCLPALSTGSSVSVGVLGL